MLTCINWSQSIHLSKITLKFIWSIHLPISISVHWKPHRYSIQRCCAEADHWTHFLLLYFVLFVSFKGEAELIVRGGVSYYLVKYDLIPVHSIRYMLKSASCCREWQCSGDQRLWTNTMKDVNKLCGLWHLIITCHVNVWLLDSFYWI